MSQATELDDLYNEATRTTASGRLGQTAKNALRPIQPSLPVLNDILNVNIPDLLQSAITFEAMRKIASRVDGRIIGTGKEDFTTGNFLYTLNYKDKTFQLLDVPGIEGDEGKYEHMVREAVAKAHLVFYVNGTNKKPEKATAEKIRSYLRRKTMVCPIVNMRGGADAYEFEEDRKSLKAGAALQQTMEVLEAVLGNEVLLPGRCVQGLLAFSSLAINSDSRKTSIHPSREAHLGIHQRKYLERFGSPRAMFEFSQIRTVAQILHDKLNTFRQDIVESNKVKVVELLIENIANLQEALEKHRLFLDQVRPDFEKCRESINGAMGTFERLVHAGRKNLWNEFFNDLTEEADHVVAEHFGDNDAISSKIRKLFKNRQEKLMESMQKHFEERLVELEGGVGQALVRLSQDIQRYEFLHRINLENDGLKISYQLDQLDMTLGLKDWGGFAFNVGSYTTTGALIGSAYPGPGTLIGAAIGAVVGVLVSILQVFTGKEKRIRKAQAQVQERIENIRDNVMDKLSEEIKFLVAPVRKEIREMAINRVDAIYSELTRPLVIIQKQITLMVHIKKQLEKMPHGTIQAIQS